MIRVGRDVNKRIRERPDWITIQVQDSSDAQQALIGLREAAGEIAVLDGGWQSADAPQPGDTNRPKYVSRVLPAKTGPFITIDGGQTPGELLATIPDIVTRHLAAQGVTGGLVAVPDVGGPLSFLRYVPRAVVLTLYPPPPTSSRDVSLPALWLEEAFAWVEGGSTSQTSVVASIESMEFPITLSDSFSLWDQAQRFQPRATILAALNPTGPAPAKRGHSSQGITELAEAFDQIGDRVHASGACYGGAPHLALAAGGPEMSDEELRETYNALKAVAKRLSPDVAYGAIAVSPTFSDFPQRLSHGRWSAVAPQALPEKHCEVVVFDAFPYQLLGPSHAQRLGAVPPDSRSLDHGRLELEFGDFSSWLPTARQEGWRVLEPCLLRGSSAAALLRQRRQAPTERQDLTASVSANTAPEPTGAEQLRRILTERGLLTDELAAALSDNSEAIEELGKYLGAMIPSPTKADPTPGFIAAAIAKSVAIGSFTHLVFNLEQSIACRMYPPLPRVGEPPSVLSAQILERAARWVVGDGHDEVWGGMEYRRFPLDSADAEAFLPYAVSVPADSSGAFGQWLIAIREDGSVRAAVGGTRGPSRPMTLVGGTRSGDFDIRGQLPDYEDELALMDSLQEVGGCPRAAALSATGGSKCRSANRSSGSRVCSRRAATCCLRAWLPRMRSGG